jgi:hypothetical protein
MPRDIRRRASSCWARRFWVVELTSIGRREEDDEKNKLMRPLFFNFVQASTSQLSFWYFIDMGGLLQPAPLLFWGLRRCLSFLMWRKGN